MLRLRVGYTGVGGTPYLSTFYFVGTTQTEADDSAVAVEAFMGAIDAAMDNGQFWTLDPVVVQIDAATGTAIGAFSVLAGSGQGATAGETLPFISQGLIQLRTGFFVNGRELRGRLFIPGLTESANADGGLALATQVILVNAAATMIASGPPSWGVWSRTHGVFADVTTATIWNQFASLRTRRPGF